MRGTSFALALACTAFAFGGCAAPARRPAPINHVVLVKLADSSEAAACLADCDRLLPGIPSVAAYAAGRPLDSGRSGIDGDYDVGLFLGFQTEDDYTAYLDHPQHQEILRLWGPRLEWLRIHDFSDATP